MAGAGTGRAGGCTPSGEVGVDGVARVAAQRGDAGGNNLDHLATTAQRHAERSARRPKQVKLAINLALRTYVQDRLPGGVVAPGGIADAATRSAVEG